MPATFQIYNSKKGIAFRLEDNQQILCTSARTFDVVCDAEKAIFAIKRNCSNPSRVQLRDRGTAQRLLIVAENGRPLAESATIPAAKAKAFQNQIIKCCATAQIVDMRPNKRGGPGACVIG